jgi:hypothetical protein
MRAEVLDADHAQKIAVRITVVGEHRDIHTAALDHADRVIERIILIISVMSLVSLVFIYQMPKLAEEELGLDGWRYNILFASFGLGAGLGALAMGSAHMASSSSSEKDSRST